MTTEGTIALFELIKLNDDKTFIETSDKFSIRAGLLEIGDVREFNPDYGDYVIFWDSDKAYEFDYPESDWFLLTKLSPTTVATGGFMLNSGHVKMTLIEVMEEIKDNDLIDFLLFNINLFN